MMSPSVVAEATGLNDELRILASGFVALLEIAQKLTRQEQELQSRLQYAFDEVCTLFILFSSVLCPFYYDPPKAT